MLLIVAMICFGSFGQKKKNKTVESNYYLNSGNVSALKFRNVGPALTAGRIADIAVNPNNTKEYYLAVASGGIWKTTNAGVTYKPIFDNQGSYSTGCVTIDPNNNNIVWVGSGENNNQRSVAYGDGVYKSEDGGNTWKNMGLKKSEHIHKIIVDPNNSNIVYVAANGPLWSAGGDRGIYKTVDGGETWDRVHHISDNTGACDLVMDPRNSMVLYAAFNQRRRHVYSYIGGGPESALKKTTDGGKTWKTIQNGLPNVDLGRIGLAISPVEPDVIFAIVEAAKGKGGFYKSTNRGASWSKQNKYSTSGNYYQEIVCHPKDVNTVFIMDTWLHHTNDGGKTIVRTGEKNKHVDNHCMWIDPNDTEHWIVGCDGGLYETWDAAGDWQYKANLPITQFYKVTVDEDLPFYNIYGGTQDNNSLGGPSRTTNNAGILNSDWFITKGGDGFESAVDPKDPNIVYAQSQYGWLVRFDKKSGEKTPIKPQTGKGEPGLRWNWDAPLLISPHDHKRLYFAANKVFRSDNRGDAWTTISEDLTQQLDRNTMPIMGRVWGIDAVRKNLSTTIFGNIVALDESPIQEDLLYAGTDDGLIQVTDDAGKTWNKLSTFPGVPSNTYVNMIIASKFEASTVYACFNNHKNGDFKPYILKSTNKGASWTSIHGNLPERGSVYALAQDHVNKDLLFAGTEFGVFFTIDGGKHWTQLSAGLPTIAVRDIAIQSRENDLVLASFGRGFYVLDDYSPLRTITQEILDKPAHMFPVKDGLMFVQSSPLGYRGLASQGSSLYASKNPPVGAVFTVNINDPVKTLKQLRQAKESEIAKNGGDQVYPSFEALHLEAEEEAPFLLYIIRDMDGNMVRKLKKPYQLGMQRVVWNFKHNTTTPIKLQQTKPGRYGTPNDGYMAIPGNYTVEVLRSINGEISTFIAPKTFTIKTLNNKSLPVEDEQALLAFYKEVSEVRRQIRGNSKQLNEMSEKLKYIKAAILQAPNVPTKLSKEVRTIEHTLYALEIELWGDNLMSKYQFETPESFANRLELVVYSLWNSSSAPTKTSRNNLDIAKAEYALFKPKVKALIQSISTLETKLDGYQTPYTINRNEHWKKE